MKGQFLNRDASLPSSLPLSFSCVAPGTAWSTRVPSHARYCLCDYDRTDRIGRPFSAERACRSARDVKAEPRTAATRGRCPCHSRRSLAASDEAQYDNESHNVGGIDRAFRARLNAHTIRPAEDISNMRSETPRL